jgi:hypothetical protein
MRPRMACGREPVRTQVLIGVAGLTRTGEPARVLPLEHVRTFWKQIRLEVSAVCDLGKAMIEHGGTYTCNCAKTAVYCQYSSLLLHSEMHKDTLHQMK